jgi:membrane protein
VSSRTLALFSGIYERVRLVAASYGRHSCSELAAAIAYRVIFSLVPFVALVVAVLDIVLPADQRERFVEWLFGELPGTALDESVDRALAQSGASAPLVATVALATLMWTASGMMGSVRKALRIIWGSERRPQYVRAKLRDLALVCVAGVLLIGAFLLSVVVQVVVEAGVDLSSAVGVSGTERFAVALAELATSGIATFAAALVVYRFVPPVRMPLAALWPGALFTAIAFQLATAGFAFYITRFADFSSVYGPLGAVLAFLLLVYVLASLALLGAELVVAAKPRRST